MVLSNLLLSEKFLLFLSIYASPDKEIDLLGPHIVVIKF